MARQTFQYDSSRSLYLTVFLICVALTIHAGYVTTHTQSTIPTFPNHMPYDETLTSTFREVPNPELAPGALETSNAQPTPNYPPLFIYRRTKKSGSSAMLDALVRALQPYGYTPIYHSSLEMRIVVRAESIKPFPRRLLIAEHNYVTRKDDPLRHAIIADTIRDGYEQITSFCRYLRHVKTCDEALVTCLESDVARAENRYRWAGRGEEDADTYIDLPLSSAHPALSTTVLRRVFPNVTLDIYNWNLAKSTCPENPLLRQAYKRLYGPLERQVNVLRQRMLALAGYPFRAENEDDGISLDDMLMAAEERERQKYDIMTHGKGKGGFSNSHKSLIATVLLWKRAENKSLVLTPRWK